MLRTLKPVLFGVVIGLTTMVGFAEAKTIGDMADNVAGNFKAIGQMLVGLAYVAGIGFGISAIFKFKQHKDNPTQVPIGTPFALLGISVLLVFLPGLYAPAGASIFGGDVTSGGATGSGLGAIGDSK